jgi:predicted glycoside hydrolase/deacetylase ChbG (UPF0249 family)
MSAAPTQEMPLRRGHNPGGGATAHGALIVNADDWGRDRETTTRTLECVRRGTVSAVSAMVFMEDSGRAAELARENKVDTGLHLNLTTPFSLASCPARTQEHQELLSRFLRKGRFSFVIYHPGLSNSFEYVVKTQLDEFRRLYGGEADRIDGHHHMHLCANVLLANLLPAGTRMRRNFTFAAGEKGFVNRTYREMVDRRLARRHLLTDYFFSLPPLEPKERLRRIFASALQSVVELETHPVNTAEYHFLTGAEIFRWTDAARIQSFRSLPAIPAVQ